MSNYRKRHEALNPEKVLCPELKSSKPPQSLFIYFIEKEAKTKSSNTKNILAELNKSSSRTLKL